MSPTDTPLARVHALLDQLQHQQDMDDTPPTPPTTPATLKPSYWLPL